MFVRKLLRIALDFPAKGSIAVPRRHRALPIVPRVGIRGGCWMPAKSKESPMKLTDSQLVILSATSRREDRSVLPFPKSLKLNAGATALVLKSLLKHKLVEEQPAGREDKHWREDKQGQRYTLKITSTGLDEIGANDTANESAADAHSPAPETKHATSQTEQPKRPVRSGSKLSLLVDLLSRETGSTIDEAAKAIGWQRHSIRGAISGALKKKLGLGVASAITEGRGRVYRIARQ